MAKTGEACSEACLDCMADFVEARAIVSQTFRRRDVSTKGQIPLRYPASEPARELVRELVCHLLASWTA